MTDYADISKSISDTIAKGGKPLTEAQYILLTGSLAVWLDKCLREYGQAVRARDAEIARNSSIHHRPIHYAAAISKEPLP